MISLHYGTQFHGHILLIIYVWINQFRWLSELAIKGELYKPICNQKTFGACQQSFEKNSCRKFRIRWRFLLLYSNSIILFRFPCDLLTYEINRNITIDLIFNSKSHLKSGCLKKAFDTCDGFHVQLRTFLLVIGEKLSNTWFWSENKYYKLNFQINEFTLNILRKYKFIKKLYFFLVIEFRL